MLRPIPGALALLLALSLSPVRARAQVAKPIRWACIGNSITQGMGANTAYPVRLGAKLGPAFQVENDGVSGTTLLKKGDNPYWKNGKLSNVFAFKPDIVTIKLGTNDSRAADWNTARYLRDYRAMIDTLRGMPSKPAVWAALPIPAWQVNGAWPFNGNEALARVVDKNIQLVGMPKWSADDVAFVRAYQTSMGAKVEGLPTKPEALAADRQGSSTSDAGDISWNVPYVRMWIPTRSSGALAGHHWSSAIGVATPVAHKGIAAGSKALVASMIDLYTDPALLAGIKKDFAAQLARYPKWKSFIPAGATPPTYLNVEEMATYRADLEKFEYDPESGKTYFEFLGLKYPPAVPSSALGKASNEPKPDKTASSLEWHWE